MTTNAELRFYWLHALSPLHVGAGRGSGYIDLPLAREKVTDHPYVPGSSVKGVFAESYQATRKKNPKQRADDGKEVENSDYCNVLHAAFGIADDKGDKGDANAGCLAFTDARLICLPVRSLYGTFAWCTSPLVLRRLKRDLDAADLDAPERIPDATQTHATHVETWSSGEGELGTVLTNTVDGTPSKVYLDDLDIEAQACPIASSWAEQLAAWVFPDEPEWRNVFRQRFLILPDDTFDFLTETAIEVQAHVKIDPDFKRVERGALWYEESLPAEAILGGLVRCDQVRGVKDVQQAEVLELLKPTHDLQMGGKAGVGKGRVRLRNTSKPAVRNEEESSPKGAGA